MQLQLFNVLEHLKIAQKNEVTLKKDEAMHVSECEEVR